jgi:hypothetical protein
MQDLALLLLLLHLGRALGELLLLPARECANVTGHLQHDAGQYAVREQQTGVCLVMGCMQRNMQQLLRQTSVNDLV